MRSTNQPQEDAGLKIISVTTFPSKINIEIHSIDSFCLPNRKSRLKGCVQSQPVHTWYREQCSAETISVSISADQSHSDGLESPCAHCSTAASPLATFCSAVLLSKHVWPVKLCISCTHGFFWVVLLGGGTEGGGWGVSRKSRARRAAGLSRDPPIETSVRAWAHVSSEA